MGRRRKKRKRKKGKGRNLIIGQKSDRLFSHIDSSVSGYQEAQCVLLWPGYCYPVTDVLLSASMTTTRECSLGVGSGT